jgi:uncharacterized protein (TIGR03435 family)
MFERFTERARRVLFFALAEATSLGSASIDPEQLLLGLLREGEGLPARLFADAGLVREDIRQEVLRRVPAATRASASPEIPFSAAAHRVLQHSADEAQRLSHTSIGSEHLLLGLLSEDGGVAADVLTSRGLRRDWVRERLVQLLRGGEPREHPGPPGFPANTFKWPWLRFVPSRNVHILYSELKPPQRPVTNLSGPGLQAYGYTLTEAIVHAWRGNPWHIDMTDGIDDGTRYDFYIQFAQSEPSGTFQQMWRDAIEQQFDVSVSRETRAREVWVARRTGQAGPMLHDCGEPEPGSGFGMVSFNLAMGRPHDAPPFPLEPFTVHSMPFFCLAAWFEEFLGGPVIDQTGLRGLYGFELTRTLTDRDELIDLLRSQAGVSLTRAEHDTPVLVVRRR